MLVLLDATTVFDMAVHEFLLEHLKTLFRDVGCHRQCWGSFISDHIRMLDIGSIRSSSSLVLGFLGHVGFHGFLLGSMLYILYC